MAEEEKKEQAAEAAETEAENAEETVEAEAVEDLEEAFADAYGEAQNEEAETADMASSKSDDAAATNSGGKGTLAKGGAPMKENPYTSPMHDLAFVLLGIMISISAFFVVVNGRLKKSIEKMRHFVD